MPPVGGDRPPPCPATTPPGRLATRASCIPPTRRPWEQLSPWLAARLELPVGPLFCIIDGPTRGRPWSSAGVRVEFRRLAAQAGVRRGSRRPTAPRPRDRTRTRGRAAQHLPAPAWPRQP